MTNNQPASPPSAPLQKVEGEREALIAQAEDLLRIAGDTQIGPCRMALVRGLVDELRAATNPAVAHSGIGRWEVWIGEMRESNGRITYSVHIDRPDRPKNATVFDSEGTTSPFSSTEKRDVEMEAEFWREFLNGPEVNSRAAIRILAEKRIAKESPNG